MTLFALTLDRSGHFRFGNNGQSPLWLNNGFITFMKKLFLSNLQSIVASNVKNLGWPLCFSPLINSRRLRLQNAFDLLFLIYRKLYTMDIQLHQFKNRLHRLDPMEFTKMIEVVRAWDLLVEEITKWERPGSTGRVGKNRAGYTA